MATNANVGLIKQQWAYGKFDVRFRSPGNIKQNAVHSFSTLAVAYFIYKRVHMT